MAKNKFQMPTMKQFMAKKIIYDQPKKDPVWVYLEKEMLANIANKPYNEKVGKWLRFLRDLKYHYYCESRRELRILSKEIGPSWYVEFASYQKDLLGYLKQNIKQDLIEDRPIRTRQCLSDLGITIYIPKDILLKAMATSVEDPGIFIWNLYTAIYKKTPSELRGEYDMNAMILMSALVFIDLDECIERLEKLTESTTKPDPPPKKKKKKYSEPDVKYGVYLQKMHVPLYCNYPSQTKVGRVKPPRPVENKIRLRSEGSYEKLCLDKKFMEKRLERNRKQKTAERICTYKFWEPPSTLRNTSPKMVAYALKLKMLKKRPKARHVGPLNNIQCNVGPVTFVGSCPVYLINCVCVLPTGYIAINGGVNCLKSGLFATRILGNWSTKREGVTKCDTRCNCTKWEPTVKKYLNDSKCKCHHLYDFRYEGKAPDKYFHPPTKNKTFWIDKSKIYQFDPVEDYIKDTVRMAVQSGDPTPEPSLPVFSASSLKESELLATFLADLSDTPLIIPHLPQANMLNNLQEWVRNRVKGKVDADLHKTFILRSQRRWLWLKHMDFKMRAYRIPFTLSQLHHMNWAYRRQIQTLLKVLLNNFVTRNRLRQIEQTRLWWSTMKYDTYPGKPFLDIYFTYMPGRMKDTFINNPYSSELTPKYGAKTCPLRR